MNYREYTFSTGEYLQVALIGLLATAMVSMLFYHSFWGFILMPIFYFLSFQYIKKKKLDERLQKIQQEFLDGMKSLNASLQAGISMENAWKEVERETLLMYGENSYFYKELKEINQQIELNVPVEKLFLQFAYRTGLEDVINFAEVFEYGKKSGGNWRKIIETTVYHMEEKQNAIKEIQVMVAAKKMEQQVMNIVPLGILLFLQFSSWEYMSVLYGNPLGILCMSVCLVGYIGAVVLAERILDIKV